jgi:hypothetical protein
MNKVCTTAIFQDVIGLKKKVHTFLEKAEKNIGKCLMEQDHQLIGHTITSPLNFSEISKKNQMKYKLNTKI